MGLLIGENEMMIKEFPYCCAVSVLCDFPYPIEYRSRKERKEVQDDVKYFIKDIFYSNKISLIILDSIQYKLYGRLMNKYGFRLLLKTIGNDSPYIYLMAKAARKKKRK